MRSKPTLVGTKAYDCQKSHPVLSGLVLQIIFLADRLLFKIPILSLILASCYQTGFSPALRSHIDSPIGYILSA